MYRKFVAAFVAVLLAVGGLFADEIKAVFKKFEGGKVTVTVDDKEKTYTVDEKATVKIKEKEIQLTKIFEKAKEGSKWVLTVDGDKVTGGKQQKKGK